MPKGIYIRTEPVWNKGLKLGPQSLELRIKRGQAIKKNLPRTAFKKECIPWNKGIVDLFTGKNAFHWRGGKVKQQDYWWIYQPNHLKAAGSYVKQCILIAEEYLGRKLDKNEIIHHLNEIKDDDRPENLYIFNSLSEHMKYHNLFKKAELTSNLI